MRLLDLFRRKPKKVSLYKYETSYRLLIYVSLDEQVQEIIWNGTNLAPPGYVIDKSSTVKLYFKSVIGEHQAKYQPTTGERYLIYKDPQSYIKQKQPMIKFYWESNYQDCQIRYSSYEEFFALNCKTMDKPRLHLEEMK